MKTSFLRALLIISAFNITVHASEKKELCDECKNHYKAQYEEVITFNKDYQDYKQSRNKFFYNIIKIESSGNNSESSSLKRIYDISSITISTGKDLYSKSSKSVDLMNYFSEKYKQNDLLQQALASALMEDIAWHEYDLFQLSKEENEHTNSGWRKYLKGCFLESFSKKIVENKTSIPNSFKEAIGDHYFQKIAYNSTGPNKNMELSFYDRSMLSYAIDGCALTQLEPLKHLLGRIITPSSRSYSITRDEDGKEIRTEITEKSKELTENETIWKDLLEKIRNRIENLKN